MSYGYFIIAIAFISAVVSTTAYILYYRDRDNEQLFQLANRAFYLMTAGVVLSFGLVVFAIRFVCDALERLIESLAVGQAGQRIGQRFAAGDFEIAA